jgi:6-phosphogluconolactonase (cycloisomerase 2 family)
MEMTQPIGWDRRRFVQIASSTWLLGAVGSRFGWAASLADPPRSARFAYIGAEHEIHVYSIAGGDCFIKLQRVDSANPVALAIRNRNLYVANCVTGYGSLPRGSVEAYAIDSITGKLLLTNRAPLALSAISPRDLAVAPDGRCVVVAVHGGGAYNVLSIDEDGRLGRVSGILKETGSGPHSLQASAHPSAVMFDRVGRVLTADQGSDTLSVLTPCSGELTVADRCAVTAGSGPTSIVLDADCRRLYVAHALNGSLSSFEYDARIGRILRREQTVWLSVVGERAVMAIHPSGETLYSSHGDGIRVWRIPANGSLNALPGVDGIRPNTLQVTSDGKCLLALCSDALLRMKINAGSQLLAAPVKVASLSKPMSIAVL